MDDFDGIRKTDSNSSNSDDSPSLLRIGLSAGFISLAQSRGRRGPKSTIDQGTNGNKPSRQRTSALSTASEDSSTLALIKAAQGIASQKSYGSSINKSNLDAVTLAALSALGQFSHASNGVLVNVIDPSTPAGGITYNQTSPASLPPNVHSSPPAAGKGGGLFKNLRGDNHNTPPPSWEGNAHANLNLFSKMQTTFSRDYASTLHSLSYSNPRTSTASKPSMGTIAHLPVRLGLTIQPISDPDRWHEGPYCHIYIAPCENIDHYRAKVRPAIRAFVNQIEGSGIGIKDDSNHGSEANSCAPRTSTPMGSAKKSANKPTANEKALEKAGLAAGKTFVAGNFGSRYIIVYVPIGGSKGSAGGANTAGSATNSVGVGGGFSGFRAGRKGVGGVTSSGVNINSGHGGDESLRRSDNSFESVATHQDAINAAAAAALPPGPIAHSSKEVKDLYMKFMKDFPNGRTVILGTLLDGSASDAGEGKSQIAAMSPLKNQEWKAFLHNLGGAIVDGFGDRVRRYDEELRRLDSKRSAFERKMSGDKLATVDDEASGFDLSHFFLVKESLAFTYEQMQMPDEAKLQYEELEAFLPEEAWRHLARADCPENKEEELGEDIVLAGDSEEFRRYVKLAGRDLHGVSRLVPEYMYVRQIRLLFQMGAVVDVLNRSKDFLFKEYRNRLSNVASEFARRWKSELENVGIDSSTDKVLAKQESLKREKSKREAEVEAWALSSSWDIKCASEHYFTFAAASETTKPGKEDSQPTTPFTPDERDAARCLSELLEFAILRLTRMGDLFLGKEGRKANPIRKATSERPEDTKSPWEPWKQLQRRRELQQPLIKQINGDDASLTKWELELPHYVSAWLKHAFVSTSTYQETYLELAESAVLFNRLAGRFRFASRLEDHRAEVLISRGDFESAAGVLSNNVGACARDQWNRAHYWRIFRLACCQRMSGDVLAYLETLTQSFNPRLASVAPPKTSALFQSDLEAIIADAAVAEPRWGAFPFLETELSIECETSKKSSQPLPFLRRKLIKHLSFVGDKLKFGLKIRSHLPRHITVNGIRLYLLTFSKYEQAYRRNGVVTEDDAFRVLEIDAPIKIEPGETDFFFSWQPMTYNIYVLATIEIQWKEASFFYDSALLRKPIIGLDIQPSEPTQTIELNPLFLIPGHVQNVRLVFQSGSDIITEGRVKFICSEGLQVVPPNTDSSKIEDAWSDECIVPINACKPGEKVVITTLAKSDSKPEDNADIVQTMKARVETFYRHESYNSVMTTGEEPDSSPMKTLLEAMVTTLDRPALTVDDAEGFDFGDNEVMINVSLQCNSPIPFSVKEWNLVLPPPLRVLKDGDLNSGMFRHAIHEGELLLLGFKCTRSSEWPSEDSLCERPILRVVLQDEFGKTFLQVLPLNLENIYKQIGKEDMYAELYTANAELKCLADEGTVGHPVPFEYRLNTQSLLLPKRTKLSESQSLVSEAGCPVLYIIISEGSDWIVSGKVQGLLDLSSQTDIITLQFRAIPTQSGVLRSFPELFLEYLPVTENGQTHFDTPPITVQCRNPEYFKSMAYTTSTSLAVPVGNEF
ncbi:hypothetical protein HJC23_007518 [Cyclotella cryptica]|uniref:TRAPPC10/Trs130 N-terminal domain-containing protein n=1 Tax=Cyclotella cryptica TaxID=29204 RepID=A0ABD3PWY0_9STRA